MKTLSIFFASVLYAVTLSAQTTVPVTFAWDLNVSHDALTTTWEVEVDGSLKPCGAVATTPMYRQCTAPVAPGVHTFRVRGTNQEGPPLVVGGPFTTQVGAWSASLTQTVGTKPGTFVLVKAFEAPAPLITPVTWKGTTFTYPSASAAPLVAIEPPASAGNFEVMIVYGGNLSYLALPPGWTLMPSYSGIQGVVMWRVGYLTRGSSAPNLTVPYTGTDFVGAVVVVLQTTAGSTIRVDSISVSGSTGLSAVAPNPPPTTALASSSLALTAVLNYAGTQWIAPVGWIEHDGTGPASNGYGDVGVAVRAITAPGVVDPGPFGGLLNVGDYWNGFTMTVVGEKP